ncbi:MAG: methylated-DNA--[protein]-cysteine S-methyltransferase, partial [Rhodobacterales bacterium]
ADALAQQSGTVPVELVGTAFQLRVWQALMRIPPGETRTYAQIAAAVGRPGAVRAAGTANGQNRVAVLIPCHRVTGTDWFGGFSAPGGVETKAALLRHEGALLL